MGIVSTLKVVVFIVLQPIQSISANTITSVDEKNDTRISFTERQKTETLGSRSLGFSAGAIGGLGMSYRRFLPNRHGYQIGGAAWGNKREVEVNVGAQYMYTIDRNSVGSRFYVLVGAGAYVAGDKYGIYNYNDNTRGPITWHRNYDLNFGAGMGFEYAPKRGVGASLEIPLSIFFVKKENSNGYEFDGIYPVPSVSLFYKY